MEPVEAQKLRNSLLEKNKLRYTEFNEDGHSKSFACMDVCIYLPSLKNPQNLKFHKTSLIISTDQLDRTL